MSPRGSGTQGPGYTERLARLSQASWKTRVDVQAPYRWNLRRLAPGRVLDVGCGIGRNLQHVGGVGVDHNPTSVAVARESGLMAYTPEEFHLSDQATKGGYDTLLVAHVLEHLDERSADALLAAYLPFVRRGGQLIAITPQERGFATDATHVRFVDADGIACHLERLGVPVEKSYSFPFPRRSGKLFPYNEFVVTGRIPN